MGFFSSLKKGVENLGDAAVDVFDAGSDVVEEAWDNDVVRAAVVGAGAYYGAGAVFGTGGAAASGTTTSSGGGFLSTSLDLGGAGSWLYGKGKEAVKDAVSSTIKGTAKNLISGGSSSGGSSQGSSSVSIRNVTMPSSSGIPGSYRASPADLGYHPKVVPKLTNLISPKMPAISATMSAVNRKASRRTLKLGSSKFNDDGMVS